MTRSSSGDPACAREAAVLTRALLRAAISLGLGGRELAKAIGVSATTVGRLHVESAQLRPARAQGDFLYSIRAVVVPVTGCSARQGGNPLSCERVAPGCVA